MRSIDFGEFLMVIKEQKAATAAAGDEGDTILAFVALGGKPDKTGIISAEKLRQTCKVRSRCPPRSLSSISSSVSRKLRTLRLLPSRRRSRSGSCLAAGSALRVVARAGLLPPLPREPSISI